MSNQPGAPILVKPIPQQVVNEGASYGLGLGSFIEAPDELGGLLTFHAELADGKPLPQGIICTTDGYISGIPANGTQGDYEVVVHAKNNIDELTVTFPLLIKERIAILSTTEINEFKAKVWEALKENLPLPQMAEVFSREISAAELYYLLQRFAVLTIWDVYNLDVPGDKKLLQLEGASKHYNIYDRGSCLVGAPKDLFTYDRTLADALQTSRVMAREVYSRNWTIELSGFNKMIRAAWVELQHLADKQGRQVDVLHFNPSTEDIRIYTEQSRAMVANEMGL